MMINNYIGKASQVILDAIAGGSTTSTTICEAIGLPFPVVSGRLNNLKRAGMIESKGYNRTSIAGHPSIVWAITSACLARMAGEKKPPSSAGCVRPRKKKAAEPEEAFQKSPLPLRHEELNAYLFGDPLPGRSALDQRRREEESRKK